MYLCVGEIIDEVYFHTWKVTLHDERRGSHTQVYTHGQGKLVYKDTNHGQDMSVSTNLVKDRLLISLQCNKFLRLLTSPCFLLCSVKAVLSQDS